MPWLEDEKFFRIGRVDALSTIVDEPFAGDLVAVYWLSELPWVEEALAWVKGCPNPMPVSSEIESRLI